MDLEGFLPIRRRVVKLQSNRRSIAPFVRRYLRNATCGILYLDGSKPMSWAVVSGH
jgi:hypothetical protein